MSTAAMDVIADLGRRDSAKWSTHGPDVLPASVAELDLPVAAPVKAALRAALDRDDLGYLGPRHERVIAALTAFAARRLRWPIDPAQVTVVADVMIGAEELLHALTEPGDRVAITPPVYPPYFSDVRQAGRGVAEAPLDADGALDLEAIDRVFGDGARVLLLCNPHNPTGRVPTRAELATIAELAASHEAWVISDEIHAPLTLPGAEHTAFLTVSDAAAQRGFALTSASKAFNVAGLKLAFVVTAAAPARERAALLRPDLHFRAGYLGAIAAEAAFTDGDAWLDELLALLDHNRRLLADRLAASLPEIGYQPPEAGYLTWLDCRALGLGDDPAATFLRQGRVALHTGTDFGRQGAGFARLNIGTFPALVEEAVSRMAAAVEMTARARDQAAVATSS